KVAVVCGYGDVGKGAAEALRGQGARVIVTEIDPICALQAAMDGFQVARLEDVVGQADFVITATGNTRIVRVEHLLRLKNKAVVGNIGHFDDEVDVAGLAQVPGVEQIEVKPQVHEWRLPAHPDQPADGDLSDRSIIVLSEGRLLNLGNATGHPSFVMSASFTNQVLAQIALWQAEELDEDESPTVERLPKLLDEKVARLHLEALGVELTELTKEQAEYIDVDVAGPYKPEHYRY